MPVRPKRFFLPWPPVLSEEKFCPIISYQIWHFYNLIDSVISLRSAVKFELRRSLQ
jgi:hypothetical protein